MFVVALLLVAIAAGTEYHLSDGFTETESRRGEDVRAELVMERMEDQPLGEYPRELSLEVSKTVAETGR